MAAVAFGELVETAMRGLGMTQARLAYELARHTDGKYLLNETGIRRIREGRRQLDPELVGALVDVLELDPAQAWPAAGLWPPDLDVEGYRNFRTQLVRPAASRTGSNPIRHKEWYPVRAVPLRRVLEPLVAVAA